MRLLGSLSLFFSTVVLFALLVPAVGMASEPHSWCIPGAGMNWGGSNDNTTNEVINRVCGAPAVGGLGMTSCCTAPGKSSRWSLACVQIAADYALALNAGDVCGRYAWTQGPIANTQQYYPRDFSLFTLGDAKGLSGDATGLVDVAGPVAAQGNVTAGSFSLNGSQQEPVALVATGSITLNGGGTVWGSVSYGYHGKLSDSPQVNYVDGKHPTATADSTSPIDFTTASSQLLNMSKQVAMYDAIQTKPSNRTLAFDANDPELNVFSIPSTALNGVTTFQFNVPKGSAVIINVTGTSAILMNAGSTTTTAGAGGDISALNLQSVLWNFPSATTLTILSTTIPGSILAPKAAAHLTYSAIVGTVVAESAAVLTQFNWNPYQVPSCGGCLCLDPTWSCSSDTAVAVTHNAALPPQALAIKAEAGFLDIPSDAYVLNRASTISPEHRIWYAFQPAATLPASKPLAVFFNGGPGSATSPLLFSYNTATMTLDPQVQSDNTLIKPNPSAWTDFANLLYIDAPATGFSYPLQDPSGNQPSLAIEPYRDAGIFLSVVTRFLLRHPALLDSRVILVAESYGPLRATLMLYNLYHYLSLNSSDSFYYDPQLYQDLTLYLSVVFPGQAPYLDYIPFRFAHQVLIEPGLLGPLQGDEFTYAIGDCPAQQLDPTAGCWESGSVVVNGQVESYFAFCDPSHCKELPNYETAQIDKAATSLTDVPTLKAALGVDPTTIDWMKPTFRRYAYGRAASNSSAHPVEVIMNPEAQNSVSAVFGQFGQLNSAYNYFVTYNGAVNVQDNWFTAPIGAVVGVDFLENVVGGVSTFMTVADYDRNIWTPNIPSEMETLRTSKTYPSYGDLLSSVVSPSVLYRPDQFDPTFKTKLADSGLMTIAYSNGTIAYISMPTYASGHTITMSADAAQLLHGDVVQWYSQSRH